MTKVFLHILIFLTLTIITQIGGLIYLTTLLVFKKQNKLKKGILFLGLYLLCSYFLIPKIAPLFGRVKIQDTANISSHSIITKLFNRNYVTADLYNTIENISIEISKKHPGIKIIYLDANFPFINKFPLLPHLSHNDGKKIDLSFIYEDSEQKISNLKPSRSGYGIFVEPVNHEINQTEICKKSNYWQYDFTKYLTFGKTHDNLSFSTKATSELINIIANNKLVTKIFIEPHLKNRMKLINSKIRFHGCGAVRHDDHIHFQIN
ncbi:MAG: hypothetical protein HWD85_08350 [Flavobacteriaceae bacterium]|nr:hypothetical protein [Flavobacteriaceae bacterium]